MINITKQGNNVIVTSDNPSSFNISNGELSVPLNTIYYVLDDESDFIQFNSTEEGNILFNGTIGQIQVNGNIVTRDNILMELDNVFNSAAIAGEGGTAGVLSINGYDGYINLKSINGQSLIGSGDITIEGGSVEETDPIFTEWKNSMNVSLGQEASSEEASISIGSKAVSVGQSIAIGRMAENTTFDQVAIGFNIKNDDTYYTNINNVLKGDENKHAYIKDNDGNYTKVLDIINNICSSVEETDPIFTEWKNADDVIVGNGAKYDIDGASEEDIQPSIMIGKGASVLASGIAIGENAYSESGAVTIGKNITSYGIVSIGSDNEGGGIAIGKNNKGSGIAIGSGITENYGGIAIGEEIINQTEFGIAIGTRAKNNWENIDNNNSIAIGLNAQNNERNSIAFGIGAKTTGRDELAIGNNVETDATLPTNINNIIKGNMNKYAFVLNEYGNYVRIPTEWTGTQSQYNALGTYYDNITYNIIEG